jgi:hypothetical protein
MNICLFSTLLSKIGFLARQEINVELLNTVTLKVQGCVTVLEVNVWLHHTIQGFVNETTMWELLALTRQFGNCDHRDASSEGQNDDVHLVPRPCTVWHMASFLLYLGQECLEHDYVALTWDQVTFIFLVLRRSDLLITDSEMLWKCKKLSDICSVHKALSSVHKAYIRW